MNTNNIRPTLTARFERAPAYDDVLKLTDEERARGYAGVGRYAVAVSPATGEIIALLAPADWGYTGDAPTLAEQHPEADIYVAEGSCGELMDWGGYRLAQVKEATAAIDKSGSNNTSLRGQGSGRPFHVIDGAQTVPVVYEVTDRCVYIGDHELSGGDAVALYSFAGAFLGYGTVQDGGSRAWEYTPGAQPENTTAREAVIERLAELIRERGPVTVYRASSARCVTLPSGIICGYWGVARYEVHLRSRDGVPALRCVDAAGRSRTRFDMAQRDAEDLAAEKNTCVVAGTTGAVSVEDAERILGGDL